MPIHKPFSCGLARSLAAVVVVLLLASFVSVPAQAGNGYDRLNSRGNQLILRAQPEEVPQIAAQYGVEVVGELTADGYAALVEGPESMTAEQLMELMRSDSRVQDLSPAQLTALPSTDLIQLTVADVAADLSKPGDFTTPCLGAGFGGLVWSGYGDQEASHQISLHEAHLRGGCGSSAVVALLDTGVDPRHPLLQGAFDSGYDFLLEQDGIPSDWSNLNQSITAIVEEKMTAYSGQSITAIVEGEGEPMLHGASFGPVLEQSITAIVETPTPPFFGHGTMVAGLVRLAAPQARIMPLRVFDGSGTAHIFDVIRAIYYAVDHGADVINMSFSMADFSPELLRAVQYAHKNGVLCVAAAGNQSQHALVYPAALGGTVAVTSVTDDGELSDFANYGTGLVDFAAPGNGVVSIYPGGAYGVGWGTSFSAPLAAGVAALLLDSFPEKRDTADVVALANALRNGAESLKDSASEVGGGRLDALAALLLTE